MPTFKNETARHIYCRVGHRQVQFSPGEVRELPFWVPYKRKGLTLVDGVYPPVPETILVSGTFDFTDGMERTFNLEFCDKYDLTASVTAGKVRLYCGNTAIPVVLDVNNDSRYRAHHEWELAPYVRITADGTATVTLHCEVSRGCS